MLRKPQLIIKEVFNYFNNCIYNINNFNLNLVEQ